MESESKHFRIGLLIFLIAASTLCLSSAQNPPNKKRAAETDARNTPGDVARGKYIVENVGMCEQCHTPREADGTLDRMRPLDGAPVFLQPATPDANWPLTAPRIGGTLPASDGDMVKLLTTGIWTNGQPLRFPMMPFRMSEADAKAVVAYLRTVQPHP